MGALKQLGSGRLVPLPARCLIGRHPACDLRLDDLRVSGEHASVRWVDAAWELRDLDSKNGTFVGDRRLSSGERVLLDAGATFTLGGPTLAFSLVDAAPPVANARNTQSGVVRVATGGLLVLPDDERPGLTLFERGGVWMAESEDSARPVFDREVVIVEGEGWLLDLTSSSALTWEAAAPVPTLETISLRFGVSQNEEHVELSIEHAGKVTKLPTRGYYYLLLTLARARLAERAASSGERGWVEREALCRMLGCDTNKLNVEIFRLRKQLAGAGVLGAADILERRPGTGQIRIGTDRFAVYTL